MTPLHVHIERLVLDLPGAGQRSGEAVRQAIESALSELAGERAAPTAATPPTAGHDVQPGDRAATAAGREAAIAIHHAVKR